MNLEHLSEVQRQAVTTTEGPVLVLAGAGSGKTSVLTNRVAYLINEKGVDPYRILAITFTNKAAQEMRERIAALVEEDVSRMAISTFHSMCARFLRYDAGKLGYQNNFTIYDAQDAQTLVKRILSQLNIDGKVITPSACLSLISRAKNARGKGSFDAFFETQCPSIAEEMGKIFAAYREQLKQENAMDFDDLLLNMLLLLEQDPQTRNYYTNRYQYILVDEYQDTNSVQYALIKILAEKYKNVFVVGDDDQSIYAWRGADIRNILDFEKDYPGAAVIKLEQNYRSHSKILDAANAVISKAEERKSKTLWSARKDGDRPLVFTAPNEYAEAEFVAKEINSLQEAGLKYSDMAVLYRSHTQARVLEDKLRTYGVPYRIYGGTSFYNRQEIKDMLAYLNLLVNPHADTALLRIINVPRRGIGEVSLEKLRQFAERQGISLLEATAVPEEFVSGAAVSKFADFNNLYYALQDHIADKTVGEAVEEVFQRSGYRQMLLLADSPDADSRIENVEELINAAYQFEKEGEDPTLAGFLENISLITDLDTLEEEGSVSLMTLHSSKGLEFDTVFLVGMEETVFPTWRAIGENKIDEERRLCYVGITRAKRRLYMTNCVSRNLYASSNSNQPSRFLLDIPPEMLENLAPAPQPIREKTQKTKTVTYRPQVEFKPQAKADPASFQVGMTVEHKKFGAGEIKSILGSGEQRIAVVGFPGGDKKMFLAFAPLKIVQ